MRTLHVPVQGSYEDLYLQSAAAVEQRAPKWLLDRRDAAFARLRETGLPTRHVEAWKYTDITALADRKFAFARPSRLTRQLLQEIPTVHEDESLLVFVDGLYSSTLSSPVLEPGVTATPLLDAAHDSALCGALSRDGANNENAFVHLNEALWRDGVVLRIAGKRRLEHRIQLLFLHTGWAPNTMISPRCAVALGVLSETRLTITHASIGTGSAFSNAVVDIDVGEGAQLELCQTQTLSPASYHFATTRITQQRDSRLHSLDFGIGAGVSRHDIRVSLAGTGSEVVLDGISAVRGRQIMDAHTVIEHLQPHCTSRQLYKGVLDDHATTVFNGIVRVHPGAAGTDGQQMNRSLLLSREAKANTKPQLEISNDDVRCTHGATIGQLSEQELFYLESRGIAPAAARDMLARGFLEEVLYRLDDRRRHADLHVLLDRYFENTGHGAAQEQKRCQLQY
jgi:Fe-S cluster assembly protein SufD